MGTLMGFKIHLHNIEQKPVVYIYTLWDIEKNIFIAEDCCFPLSQSKNATHSTDQQ